MAQRVQWRRAGPVRKNALAYVDIENEEKQQHT